jgi:hypothetical protein
MNVCGLKYVAILVYVNENGAIKICSVEWPNSTGFGLYGRIFIIFPAEGIDGLSTVLVEVGVFYTAGDEFI